MTEPQEPADQPDAPATEEDPAERLKQATSKYESERRLRNKLEKELAQVRNAQLTESEKAVEEAKAAGRKEGAKSVGGRLASAEFRAKAAEAKLPPSAITALLEIITLDKFVDEDGEPDTELIQATVDKIAESLAAAENGRAKPVKAPDIPKGVHPKSATDTDWLRSVMRQD